MTARQHWPLAGVRMITYHPANMTSCCNAHMPANACYAHLTTHCRYLSYCGKMISSVLKRGGGKQSDNGRLYRSDDNLVRANKTAAMSCRREPVVRRPCRTLVAVTTVWWRSASVFLVLSSILILLFSAIQPSAIPFCRLPPPCRLLIHL